MPNKLIIPLLRFFGASIGLGSDIDNGLILHRLSKKSDLKKLIIGEKVYIGHNMLLDLSTDITIGNDCGFGANCQIWTHVGDYSFDYSDYKDTTNPVIINDGVVIYSGSIVNQGVIIKKYARVGASSVVLKNIPEKEFWAGIPAKLINIIKW
ncbi:MAG: acyltransferase [Candidatus Cloacimonetes bacterium]|nr:acyltransferase [Candidatus Cloacimonadota bacterium]